MKSLIRSLVRLFYRLVEVSGGEHLPGDGPLLLVANHFNGLVDAMIVLAVLPRPVVFVAKSTLWKIPVLSTLLDLMGVVPVVRRSDLPEEKGPASSRNDASLERLARVLAGGGAVLIFPEGRSHSDPALSPIKTGAARILTMSGVPAAVVPLGLWFTRKEAFRSEVLVKVGAPVVPAGTSVDAWTEAIRDGLEAVTLNAESWRQHEAARALEAIYGDALPAGGSLEASFGRQRLLHEAREVLARVDPESVSRLARRAAAFERLCARAGLAPAELDGAASETRPRRAAAGVLWRALLGLPPALLGALAFYVPYRLVGLLAPRLAREQRDQVAFLKLLLGMLLHPLALAVEVLLVGRAFGAAAAVIAALLLPACGIVALLWADAVEPYTGRFRALAANLFAAGRSGLSFLRAEREALRAECARLQDVYLHNRAP